MQGTEIDSVAQAALEKLGNSSVRELRHLRVDQGATELWLRGRVRTYYHKQLAQETVLPIAGRLRVVNLVDVECSADN